MGSDRFCFALLKKDVETDSLIVLKNWEVEYDYYSGHDYRGYSWDEGKTISRSSFSLGEGEYYILVTVVEKGDNPSSVDIMATIDISSPKEYNIKYDLITPFLFSFIIFLYYTYFHTSLSEDQMSYGYIVLVAIAITIISVVFFYNDVKEVKGGIKNTLDRKVVSNSEDLIVLDKKEGLKEENNNLSYIGWWFYYYSSSTNLGSNQSYNGYKQGYCRTTSRDWDNFNTLHGIRAFKNNTLTGIRNRSVAGGDPGYGK